MSTTTYYWDLGTDNTFLEENENGDTSVQYTQEPSLYGQLIAQELGGLASYYNYDAQGSTRELTDDSEEVTDTYAYSASGEAVVSEGATGNSFRYKASLGYHTDSNTGELAVRARKYQPTPARWLSRDPLFLGDVNSYRYAYNSPIGFVDPSGLKPSKCLGQCLTPRSRRDRRAPANRFAN